MLQFASEELQADHYKATRPKPESGPRPGGSNYRPTMPMPSLWRGNARAKPRAKTEGANAGVNVHYEVNGHQPFDWDGYYVEPDLTKKAGHYGFSDHHEAKYYVDYVPME